MSEPTASCITCGETFPLRTRGDVCPMCESEVWVPDDDPDRETTSDRTKNPPESGSKKVKNWWLKTLNREGKENVQELHIETEDDWEYVFREPAPNSGHELYRKFRSDGTRSESEVVPVPVAEYIDDMQVASLNYAKLIVHPSKDIYAPPREDQQ